AGWMGFQRVALGADGVVERDSLAPGWKRDILTRFRFRFDEVEGLGMVAVAERAGWDEETLVTGSHWHVLRYDLIRFIHDHRQDIRDRFSNVPVADEHAFQWIAGRSPDFGQVRRDNSVFMEFRGASPRRLDFGEAAEIAARGRFLFARKAAAEPEPDDWIHWAERLGNDEGAAWLRHAFETLQPLLGAVAQAPDPRGGLLLGMLRQSLTMALGREIQVRPAGERRHVIDVGRIGDAATAVSLLCLTEPALGLVLVPALWKPALPADHALQIRPPVRTFGNFVCFPIGGHSSWKIGHADSAADIAGLAQMLTMGRD
ncbi:MAG TPA: hypothetical protein VKS60_25450, partial [Stellaceae bacterium]|nr:hypothetical protein [Stellaceae bacterium]